MLLENGAEKASLIVVLRVKTHAFGKPERIPHHASTFLVVVISVVFVEHRLAEGVRLSFFAFPFWHRRPRLVPEGGMVFALAAMEDLPL